MHQVSAKMELSPKDKVTALNVRASNVTVQFLSLCSSVSTNLRPMKNVNSIIIDGKQAWIKKEGLCQDEKGS